MNEFQQIFALSMISNMAQNLVNAPGITTPQLAAEAMQIEILGIPPTSSMDPCAIATMLYSKKLCPATASKMIN